MKIINTDNIIDLRQAMLKQIASQIEPETITKLLHSECNVDLGGKLQYENGKLIIDNEKIAYKLNYKIKSSFSVILNRSGKIIDIESSKLTLKKEFSQKKQEDYTIDESKKETSDMDSMINDISKLVESGKPIDKNETFE